MIHLCPPDGADPVMRIDDSDCPYKDAHTLGPENTLTWYGWVDDMMKTQKQFVCPGCGLFRIVVPKSAKVKVKRIRYA